jgi:hypothetical protein
LAVAHQPCGMLRLCHQHIRGLDANPDQARQQAQHCMWSVIRRLLETIQACLPKQISTGDRTILGKISRRGNRYLRALFVQAAWVVLVRVGPKHWDRYGLKSWIEAAKKRLHHNVLAIALANKFARIAWAVLNKERKFECIRTNKMSPRAA